MRYCCYGGNTGEEEQNEHKECSCRAWREIARFLQVLGYALVGVTAVEHAQRTDYQFLCGNTCYQCNARTPVLSDRCKHRLYGMSNHGNERVLVHTADCGLVCNLFKAFTFHLCHFRFIRSWIVAQKPYYHGRQQNHCANLLYVLRAFLPHVTQCGTQRGPTVGWQLHYKWRLVLVELCKPQQTCRYNCNDYAKQIKPHEYQCCVLREECSGKQYEHRQACTARHERSDKHRYNAAAAAFYGACCHNGRHVATESHEHWDERFAVQSHLVHESVHDECRACHVAGILHQ